MTETASTDLFPESPEVPFDHVISVPEQPASDDQVFAVLDACLSAPPNDYDEFALPAEVPGVDRLPEVLDYLIAVEAIEVDGDVGILRWAAERLHAELAPAPEDAPVAPAPVPVGTGRKGAKQPPPTPKVPTRDPENQNEHLAAVLRHTKKTTQHVAIVLHVVLGRKLRRKFVGGKHAVSTSILMEETGLSNRVVIAAVRDAVGAGLFRRIDNGKGGRSSANSAVYQAVVPR